MQDDLEDPRPRSAFTQVVLPVAAGILLLVALALFARFVSDTVFPSESPAIKAGYGR